MSRSPRGDVVPLVDRLGALHALRVTMAMTVVGVAAAFPGTVGVGADALAAMTAFYLLVATAADLAGRVWGFRVVAVGRALLLVDAVFLALVQVRAGGVDSVLGFLVYVHVIGVTLLASYRTGLRIALWHTVLLFASYYAQVTDAVPWGDPSAELRAGFVPADDAAVFHAVAFWFVAIATAAFSSLNERELRRGKSELRALSEFGHRVEEVRRADEVMHVLVSHAMESFGFLRGAALAKANGHAQLVWMDRGRFHSEVVPAGVPDEVVERASAGRRPLLAAGLDDERDAMLARLLPDARNVIVIPLIADGEAIGALVLERGGGPEARIPARTVGVLSQLGGHGALALRNAWLLGEVERLATVDALTGLTNRRVFDAALEREVARSLRAGEPCSVALIDIDRFKSINDTHGHQMGDAVLGHVGAALAQASRDADLVARYGGEEFAVILPSCPPSQSVEVVERFRAAVAGCGSPIPVTVSAGVASLPKNGRTAAALVGSADEALYESKRRGRDRTTRSQNRPLMLVRSEAH
jgi:two-component system cell cycle response regulator